jgi:H+/Cl- antiporter ClcA
MLGPGLFGIFAAIIVAVPGVLRALFPGIEWNSPYFILALTVIAIPLQRRLGRSDRATAFPKGYYEGLSDLRIHIHLPSGPETSESASRWMMRGAMSFLLALFGGVAGSEGAAVEFIHGITLRSRGRVVRWFEQRRRTDAGVTLAAAIAAVFGAPFAAMLVPMELGIGGRTLSVAFGAISAYLTSRYLTQFMAWSMLPIGGLDLSVALQGFHLIHLTTWLAVGFIALVSGVLGALVIRFVRYGQESLVELFDAPAWLHVMIGGGLLALVFWIYQAGHAPSWMLLNMALSPQASASEVGLLFLVGLLSLTLVLSAFGTVGIFWPLFSLGSFGGLLVNSMVFGGVPGFTGVAALIGGAAFWGAVLGTPLAGAVLSF